MLQIHYLGADIPEECLGAGVDVIFYILSPVTEVHVMLERHDRHCGLPAKVNE